jgi:hypothetical protein
MALLLAAFALACSDSAVEPHEHELLVNLTLSDDHLSTLEVITFTVTVTNDHGDPITDFSALEVEYELEGTGTWRGIDMTLQGTAYVGTREFTTSGDYHFRVSGMRGTATTMEVLYEDPGHHEIERAHVTLGAYKVEFESFPGHIHENETATLRFWITDQASGQAVTGLTVTIECGNPDGSTESHPVTDNSDGVYDADHLFAEAGDAHAGLSFTGVQLSHRPRTLRFLRRPRGLTRDSGEPSATGGRLLLLGLAPSCHQPVLAQPRCRGYLDLTCEPSS